MPLAKNKRKAAGEPSERLCKQQHETCSNFQGSTSVLQRLTILKTDYAKEKKVQDSAELTLTTHSPSTHCLFFKKATFWIQRSWKVHFWKQLVLKFLIVQLNWEWELGNEHNANTATSHWPYLVRDKVFSRMQINQDLLSSLKEPQQTTLYFDTSFYNFSLLKPNYSEKSVVE